MTLNWKPNSSAPLWDKELADEPLGPFFNEISLEHIPQIGPSCVPTTLAMIARSTGADVGPDDFKPIINSLVEKSIVMSRVLHRCIGIVQSLSQ